MKKLFVIASISILLLLPQWPSLACGPFFPDTYLSSGDEIRVLRMPRGNFHRQIEVLLQIPQIASTSTLSSWTNTLQKDLDELRNSLRNERKLSAEETEQIIQRYEELRRAMKKYHNGTEEDAVFPKAPPSPSKAPFDLNAFQDALTSLPEEYRLYLAGAAAWYSDDWGKAVAAWQNLLALPSEQRKMRSTWASFMIGKTLLLTDPDQAIFAFEQTRSLAEKGYADSLGLAEQSCGWQALIEIRRNRPQAAIHLYLEMYRNGSWKQRKDAGLSLYWCARNIIEGRKVGVEWVLSGIDPAAMAADPLVRQVVTCYIISKNDGAGFGYTIPHLQRWNDLVWNHRDSITDREAERTAWAAYVAGDFERAGKWLSSVSSLSPEGQYLRAKVFLREDKVEEAIQDLRAAKDYFPINNEWYYLSYYPGRGEEMAWGFSINGDLGTLLLGRKSYADSMDAFLRAGDWADAAYVAERVLTAQELETYVRKHARDAVLNTPPSAKSQWFYDTEKHSTMDDLRHLLSRRYARLKDWNKAREFCPEEWKSQLDAYIENRISAESKSPGRKKAGHYMQAAFIARENGMEILGTEMDRDGYIFNGQYYRWVSVIRTEMNPYADPVTSPALVANPTHGMWLAWYTKEAQEQRKRQYAALPPGQGNVLSASEEEKRRVWQSASRPYKRFHYRYIASDLMWQAAQLLPDNDTSTALALYHGGMYIQDRDPKAADKFYKALVRRCGKLPLGREADRLRWFPKVIPQ